MTKPIVLIRTIFYEIKLLNLRVLDKRIILGMIFLIVIGSLSSASATSVKFDQSNEVLDHSGFITINEPGMAGGGRQTISVDVSASLGEHWPSFNILESAADDGIFVSDYIKFADVDSGALLDLDVTVNQPVTVTYSSLSDSTNIVAANGGAQLYDLRNYYTDNISCTAYGNDGDGDGICDSWEDQSTGSGLRITLTGTTGTYTYPCDTTCPSKLHKDVFVEIDYMAGHKPDQKAIDHVIAAFNSAPNINSDGTRGIHLHVQVDNGDISNIPHAAATKFPGSDTLGLEGFDQIKARYFGTSLERSSHPAWLDDGWRQKKQAFHYALSVHSQDGATTSSGISEVNGNDLLISLGSFAGQVGSTDQQEGTLMHELGHNLGLHHGGPLRNAGVSVSSTDYQMNCKPNYISVMSHSRQFSDLVSNRPLNYSGKAIGLVAGPPPQITENSINEITVLGGYGPDPEQKVVFGSSPTGPSTPPATLPLTNTAINWDQTDGLQTGRTVNLNKIVSPTTGLEVCSSSLTSEVMKSYVDWSNLQYTSRGTGNFADGITVGTLPPIIQTFEKNNTCPTRDALFSMINYNVNSQPLTALASNFDKLRNCAGGVEGMSYKNVIASRIVRLDAYDFAVNSTDNKDFKVPSKAEQTKKNIQNDLDKISNLVFKDKLDKAIIELVKENDVIGEVVGNKTTKTSLQDALSDIIVSYTKGLAPEVEHIDATICKGYKIPINSGEDYLPSMSICITGGKVIKVKPNVIDKAIGISIKADSEGILEATIPSFVLDAQGDNFIVLVDGEEQVVTQKLNNTMWEVDMTIPFSQDDSNIEIVGTKIIPEFGPMVPIVLAIAIMSIITVTKSRFINRI